jgi:hypothetical protein
MPASLPGDRVLATLMPGEGERTLMALAQACGC